MLYVSGKKLFSYLLAFGFLATLGILYGCGGVSDGVGSDTSPDVTVTPGNTTFSENGGSGAFTVALNTAPNGAVVLDLASDDLTEATVEPGQLTFTSSDWSIPQTVTLSGVNDNVADGNQQIRISLSLNSEATTDINGYGQLAASVVKDVPVTVQDDDLAAVTVTPGSTTFSENGGAGAFSVQLNTAPNAEVVIALTSTDTTEATLDKTALVFTSEDWDTPQTVTLLGVDDQFVDGNQTFLVSLQINTEATTDTTGYGALAASALEDVSVTVQDDDQVGVTVVSGSTTFSENGGAGFFSVVLNTAPSGRVVIDVASEDTTEATVGSAQLSFTASDWDVPQQVALSGIDDNIADGNRVFKVSLAVNAGLTEDTDYAALEPSALADVPVTVQDDDEAGVTVTPDVTTFSENGGLGSFTLVLNTKPNNRVVINVISGDTTEATVAPSALTFTEADWNTPQTVNLSGADDDLADGNRTFDILVNISGNTTDSTGYADLPASAVKDVEVTVIDDDKAGVTVTRGTTTFSENGGSGFFNVRLNTKPDGNVLIEVLSQDAGEATVDKDSLLFSTSDWNTPQTVTLSGVDDAVADGNQSFAIVVNVDAAATADSTGYAALAPSEVDDVSVTVTDDDKAGVTVTPGTTTFSELDGSGSFTVVLNTQPDGAVVIAVSSDDTTEATVAPATLSFSAGDWNTPQAVTLSGVDDAIADGNQSFAILVNVDAAATADTTGYAALATSAVDDVAVTVTDDDEAGVTVTPGITRFSELSGSGSFTVVLNTQPNGEVVIAVSSDDTTEATVAPATLSFAASDWNTPQTVSLSGVDDAVADGNQSFAIVVNVDAAATADTTGYAALAPSAVADVGVTVTDDDEAAVTVTPGTTRFSELDGSGSFTVVLNTQPDGEVVIAVSSDDTTEATAAPTALSFSAGDWNTPQTVTLSGVDDDVADGNQSFAIVVNVDAAATADTTGYAALTPSAVDDVAVTVTDDDEAAVTVTPGTTRFSELDGSGSFTVVLNTQPDGEVVIAVSSDDTTEATAAPTTLGFSAGDWNTPQTVSLSGVDDDVADGNQSFAIVVNVDAAATADTTGYAALAPSAVDDVAVTVTDNDEAGVTVTPGTTTFSEKDGAGSFTVVLNTEPDGEVVISVASDDTTEATVDAATLSFAPKAWNTPQTVTLSGVDDDVADGNQSFAIVVNVDAAATVDTTGYAALAPSAVDDVSVTVTDNDEAGVTVTPGTTTFSEKDGEGSFTVVLNTEPDGEVMIAVSSDDTTEATAAPTTLGFSAGDWNTPQTVALSGVDDDVADGNQSFAIVVNVDAPATADTTGYAALASSAVDDVSVTVTDNDEAGVTVTPGTTTFSEKDGEGSFTVVLNTEPDGEVVIAVVSDDTTEATVDPATLSFAPKAWNTPQTVTLSGVDDAVADGNQSFAIVVNVDAAATADTTGYAALAPSAVDNVGVTVTDDDEAGVTVTPGPTTFPENGAGSFTVELNTIPDGQVVIDITVMVADPADPNPPKAAADPTSLTFNPNDRSTAQTVTVTGLDNAENDGDQNLNIVLSVDTTNSSDETGYKLLGNSLVAVTVTDDEGGGGTVPEPAP